jgi:hypothetical protein
MAIPAQGCVFTWGSDTLQEIQELELRPARQTVSFGGSRNSGARTFSYVGGEMTLVGFSSAGLEHYKIGRSARMIVTVRVSPTQRQILHNGFAEYASANIRASVNGALQFAYQFRLYGALNTIGTLVDV